MPNDNTAICECGVVLDLPASRNGIAAISTRDLTILIANAKANNKNYGTLNGTKRSLGKKQYSDETSNRGHGSSSSVMDYNSTSRPNSRTKKNKKSNSSRRSRSAERTDSHYTYIDSGSSVISSASGTATTEALYCTIDGDDDDDIGINTSTNSNGTSEIQPPLPPNRPQKKFVSPIPSMTSPPPTYDAAISNSTWQKTFPPSYEYLCKNDKLFIRSHTPPPPWTESCTPEQAQYYQTLLRENEALAAHHAALRRQQVQKQAQRHRAMPPRSQSETRAQQMIQDHAFCMETTAIQSAFDHGLVCSIM